MRACRYLEVDEDQRGSAFAYASAIKNIALSGAPLLVGHMRDRSTAPSPAAPEQQVVGSYASVVRACVRGRGVALLIFIVPACARGLRGGGLHPPPRSEQQCPGLLIIIIVIIICCKIDYRCCLGARVGAGAGVALSRGVYGDGGAVPLPGVHVFRAAWLQGPPQRSNLRHGAAVGGGPELWRQLSAACWLTQAAAASRCRHCRVGHAAAAHVCIVARRRWTRWT